MTRKKDFIRKIEKFPKQNFDETWQNQLEQFIHQPLPINTPLLTDEDISREKIYTREDEILKV